MIKRLMETAVVLSCSFILAAGSLVAQNQNGQQRDQAILEQEQAQAESPNVDLPLRDFRPQPKLIVAESGLTAAQFPVIDVHTHFRVRFRNSAKQLDAFVKSMDAHNIALCVSLDATLGKSLDSHWKYLSKHKDRFAVFVHIDFQGAAPRDQPSKWACNQPGFAKTIAMQLQEAKRQGALGVKFFKQFGLRYKNIDGSLLTIDDERWDPIWKACGELEMPVIIHTADPAAFFDPIDKFNERYEELTRRPEWSFHGDEFPSRDELLESRNRVIERHPSTIFIGAHIANNAEDLATVGEWLEQYPNLYVEFASRIAELGRQPYTARRFFIRYQDRILFGTDGPWPELRLTSYWRFLETYDENFQYSEKGFPPQGLWRIHGIGLPEEVLQKIYFKNVLGILPELQTRYENASNHLSNSR